MEAPLSPSKRSHSSFDLFVEAASIQRLDDETLGGREGGVYSNSGSLATVTAPSVYGQKRSKFSNSFTGT